jgi:hypothetical protein
LIIKRVPNFLLNGMTSSNYWGDGSDGTLNTVSSYNFTTVQDSDAYVANLTDLTINYGHTLSVSNRNKGLFVYCQGNAYIAGTLSMTGKGAYANPVSAGVSSTGLRLARMKTGGSETLSASDVNGFGSALISAEANQDGISGNGSIYSIARTGGAGGAQVYGASDVCTIGNSGSILTNGTGGGGSGGACDKCYSGYGTAGTCFGGGAGGAGSTSRTAQGNAALYGGQGGICPYPSDSNYGGGGGAGNPGGTGYSRKTSYPCYPGEDGTGGIIVLFVAGNLTIASTGIIEAQGLKGGNASSPYYPGGGGSSGGGRIIILYAGTYSNSGTITCAGGIRSTVTGQYTQGRGGAGGAGKITIDQIDL